VATDVRKRQNSYEFLSVYYALYLFKEAQRINIRAVFSNFHALGIFYVGHYPLDLAMVEERGRLLLFNFDGQFCHGCRAGCAPLEKYASGKSRQQVEEETRRRDHFIRAWVDGVNNRAGRKMAIYIVASDCHHPIFNMKHLKTKFATLAPLVEIVQPYRDIEAFSKLLLDPASAPCDTLSRCPDSIAYTVTVQCRTPPLGHLPRSAPSGPLFVCGSGGEDESCKLYRRQTGATAQRGQSVILTKDYVSYLLSSRQSNFKIDKILGCLLYPRWRAFNRVFAELVERRNSDQLAPAEKRVLKNVVNYACGYFGLNSAKEKMRHPKMRLGTKVKRTINLNKTMVFSVESFDTSDYIIFHSAASQAARRYSSPVPVPLYLSVVEMGKLRLLQILDWLEMGCEPGTVRHLYTNVDNLILALAAPNLDSLPSPRPAAFAQLRNHFFNGGKPLPGGLKLEWQVGPGRQWKFASCALQNWAVVTDATTDREEEDRSKTNLFAGVSARRSYECACKMLDKETVTLQLQRRVNKMVGTEEHLVEIKFVPK
jgi:hypothetical protein